MAEHIDGPLYVERLGRSGRPVVFVHGLPLDHSCWTHQLDRFSTWYRCLGVDLPGFGRSPRARAGLTIPDLASACWEAVDDVGADEPTILVGLSIGWHVVMHMAHQRPQQTAAIIMSGCPYREGPKPYTRAAAAEFAEQGMAARRGRIVNGWSPAFRSTRQARYVTELLLERNDTSDPETIAHVFDALHPPDPDWLFEDVAAPSLIISGGEDPVHAGAFALRDRIAGCELVTIEGAGHVCNLERPWDWDARALTFLAARGLLPETGPVPAAP